MPADLTVPISSVWAFLIVLSRVAGVFLFVPIPVTSHTFPLIRVLMTIGITAAVYPHWPVIRAIDDIGALALWMILDGAIGLSIGLAVAFFAEVLMMAFQMIGLQAGYTFASTMDPVTNADSTIMQTFAQILAGLLFFTMDLHHEVLRAFTASLAAHPPGTFNITVDMGKSVLQLGSVIFSAGARIALPIVCMMLMIDFALALLGRINAHLQLVTIAFPLKMLAAITLIGALLAVIPRVYVSSGMSILRGVRQLMAM